MLKLKNIQATMTKSEEMTERCRPLWLLVLTMLCHTAYAQLDMGSQQEKFSLSATVDGVADSDYSWDTDERDDVADGRMKRLMNVRLQSNVKLVSGLMGSVSVQPFYHYSSTRLQTDWRDSDSPFDFPDEHHHFGVTLSASMNLMLGSRQHGKPMTLIATTAPNFSEKGFEQMSGLLAAMVHVSRTEKTYLGLGAIYLYGSPLSWPLWPLVVFRHQFDKRWKVGGMFANWQLSYQTSPKVRLAFGTELASDKIYFRPGNEHLPRKALYDLISERAGLFANWQATKELAMELGTGLNIPFYGRVRDISHSHVYMKLHASPKPFVQLKGRFALPFGSKETVAKNGRAVK